MIIGELLGPLIPWAVGALGFIGAILAAWFGGQSRQKAKGETLNLKQELDAHERINEADIGVGATDADRAARLRDMADKWRD